MVSCTGARTCPPGNSAKCIYDPEKIAVGGGISARPLLIRMLQQEVTAIYDNDPFGLPRAVVTAGQFQNDANLIGACCVFRDRNCE